MGESREPNHLVIGDGQGLLVEGVRAVCGSQFDFVHWAMDGPATVRFVESHLPGLVILDTYLAPIGGLDICRVLRSRYPQVPICFLTSDSAPETRSAALAAGGNGYLLKTATPGELIKAIQLIQAGGKYGFTDGGTDSVAESARLATAPKLTGRQRQVLEMIVGGEPAKVIAHVLGISTKTVEFHKATMRKILGARNTAGLVRYAVENAILPARQLTFGSGRF